MATRPDHLRPDDRQPEATSVVRFEAEAGVGIRRARVFEDGELASESLTACLTS